MRYWFPVLFFVAVIITVSAQPNLRTPWKFRNSDKVAHVLEYGVLGLLLARAWWHTLPGASRATIALAGLGCGVAMGACDESFQRIIPGREPSKLDLAADTLGVALAQAFYIGVIQRGARDRREVKS
jgi:VanZ family protein